MAQNEPAPAPGGNNGGGTRFTTHFWTVVGSVAGVLGVLVAVIFGITQCSSSDSPAPTTSSNPPLPTTTQTGAPTTTVPPPLAQGHRKLVNVEGIDLDTGQVHDQNVPGVDMSPSKTADSLNAMTDGKPRFAVPRDDSRTGPDRCTAIPLVAWTQTLDDVYHLPTGSHLCVQTDQRNLADLTLTHIPSAGEQYLEFDFVTRRAG